jgi:serine/threonine-protein kinase HipA
VEAFIEIHQAGTWRGAALLQGFGDDRCRLEYLPQYIFGDKPAPISLALPVEFAPEAVLEDGSPDRRVPPFLYDLVPQGKGRRYLIDLLGIGDTGDKLVMPLLFNGAFNPIGCLRISSAVDFYNDQARKNPQPVSEGFTLDQIENKTEEFLNHMALHAMLAAGTTGVQGVAPKFLLTADSAGRLYADMALPDARARDHWLVKLPRGKTDRDLLVHRSELAYLKLSALCGVRALDDPHVVGSMLFVRRFDRQCGPKGTVVRHHQESLASLAGTRGFGVPTSQNAVLAAIRRHVTDPYAETLEFLKRDVLNLAMRNTDNHARNTAVQRLEDGTVRLTPLFDFCPMFLDPEVVPRTVQWRDRAGTRLDTWTDVLKHLDVPAEEREKLVEDLRGFEPTVAELPGLARAAGVDDFVLEQCLASIDVQVQQLRALVL